SRRDPAVHGVGLARRRGQPAQPRWGRAGPMAIPCGHAETAVWSRPSYIRCWSVIPIGSSGAATCALGSGHGPIGRVKCPLDDDVDTVQRAERGDLAFEPLVVARTTPSDRAHRPRPSPSSRSTIGSGTVG